MTGLTLLTLNIEADRHLDRVHAAIAAHRPDIICLQEALVVDCPRLAAIGDYQFTFALSARWPHGTSGAFQPPRDWGLAVLTRVPLREQAIIYYSEDTAIRTLNQPNDPRRAALVTELEHMGRTYRFITTHFTWSEEGRTTDEQRSDFRRLKQRVLDRFSHYILCGDFNAPRGGELFGKFPAELGLIDHLPQRVTTTIDPKFHIAGDLQLVVDTIFSTAEYAAHDVRVLNGVSDHMGILAEVEKRSSVASREWSGS